jgi:hypothetical protein
LERILKEPATIEIVSSSVCRHQSGALARCQLVSFGAVEDGLLVFAAERAERTGQRGPKLTPGQLLGGNRTKL